MAEIPRATVLMDLATTDTASGTLVREYLRGLAAGDDFLMYSLLAVYGQTNPTELAQRISAPLTTVSDRLSRIVERGHAERIPNPADGRSALFQLTEDGWAAFWEAQPRFLEMLGRVHKHLDRPLEEIRAALASLERALVAALNEKKTPVP